MFQLNKIQAHINALNMKLVRLEAFRRGITDQLPLEESKISFKDRDRIKEVDTQIQRTQNQIANYQAKLVLHTPPEKT